jgi:hypothetical protein
MILVDLNQVMISNLMAQIGNHTNIDVDENLLRHMILNAIRGYRKKFNADYGELVICCDSTNIWRKDYFPYYKAHRKKARQDSELNWHDLFNSLNKVRDELKEHFPYKHLRVDAAEADDIIGVICHEHGALLGDGQEKILILSGDKDFAQLQKYTNVHQYDPVRKRHLKHNDPHKYLLEHILKGDRGDGIPNILSPGDTFVIGKRQKPLRQTTINTISGIIGDKDFDDVEKSFAEEWVPNFIRNRTLVDLSLTPGSIRTRVLKQFDQEPPARGKLFNYFIKNQLKNLMENIGEF